MSFADRFKPATMKYNWEKVKANPHASAQLQYMATKWIAIFLMCVIGYQFIHIFLTFKGGGGTGGMANLTRGFMLLVGIIVVSKLWTKIVIPARKRFEHFKNMPMKVEGETVDVEKEVDEIFDHFNKEKKE